MKRALVAALLLMTTSIAFAEDPAAKEQPSPDEMKQMMEASFGAMVPMMGKMSEAMIEAQLKIAQRPETAKAIATFKKNLYTELIRQGFTKKEALEMVLNTPIPSAAPGMK